MVIMRCYRPQRYVLEIYSCQDIFTSYFKKKLPFLWILSHQLQSWSELGPFACYTMSLMRYWRLILHCLVTIYCSTYSSRGGFRYPKVFNVLATPITSSMPQHDRWMKYRSNSLPHRAVWSDNLIAQAYYCELRTPTYDHAELSPISLIWLEKKN